MLEFQTTRLQNVAMLLIKSDKMHKDPFFSLNDNGFLAEAYNSESTLVLDETGGPAITPLYLIVIRNAESGVAYRLKGINFCSECIISKDSHVPYSWTNGKSRATFLADKVQKKGYVDLNLWDLMTPDTTQL